MRHPSHGGLNDQLIIRFLATLMVQVNPLIFELQGRPGGRAAAEGNRTLTETRISGRTVGITVPALGQRLQLRNVQSITPLCIRLTHSLDEAR
jgi:hypothetical protein